MNPSDWLRRVAATIHRPGAKLTVRFENLDGYRWAVAPFAPDDLSHDIAHLTDEFLRVMVQEVLGPLEAVYRYARA